MSYFLRFSRLGFSRGTSGCCVSNRKSCRMRQFIDIFGLPPNRHHLANASRSDSGSITLMRTIGSAFSFAFAMQQKLCNYNTTNNHASRIVDMLLDASKQFGYTMQPAVRAV